MATVLENGTGLATATQDIVVTYKENAAQAAAGAGEYKVTVSPEQVHENTTVFFKTDKGGKIRIAFLSPQGNETDIVLDSQAYTITKGGNYQFNCYFTPAGSAEAINIPSGGVLDVIPHR